MEKVLILGSKGNLGSQLVKIFKDEYVVIGWDREDIDIGNRAELTEKIQKLKPEVIINAVAYNVVDKCEDDDAFLMAKLINGTAVGWLADVALAIHALLIHYSSDYVFDGEKQSGYSEFDIPNPVNRYGKSKLMGEEALLERAPKGLKHYLIRPSKLFGPRGDSALAKPSFFDLMLDMAKREKELKLISGEEISCFTYTKDLANTTQSLIESNKPFGIYHVTNNGPASWYEGARLLFELVGNTDVKLIPIPSKDLPRPAKRPKNSTLKNTKLPPLRGWDMALKEYLNNK